MPGKAIPASFGSVRVKPPFITAGMRIGVMGGSFNPPHDGHELISRTALRRLGLDTDPSVRKPHDQQIVLLNRDALTGNDTHAFGEHA